MLTVRSEPCRSETTPTAITIAITRNRISETINAVRRSERDPAPRPRALAGGFLLERQERAETDRHHERPERGELRVFHRAEVSGDDNQEHVGADSGDRLLRR